MKKLLKIKFNKNFLYYFLGAVAASIFIFYWHITKPVTLDCRFGPYKDESGINRMDFIPYQELRINKRNRTMTFYHLKAIKGSTKYLGITTGPVKYVSSGSSYKTKFIKLEKLTDDEKMSFQTGHETDYIWPKLKDEKFRIIIDRVSFFLDFEFENKIPKDILKETFKDVSISSSYQGSYVRAYKCEFPREKKKKKSKKIPNKI